MRAMHLSLEHLSLENLRNFWDKWEIRILILVSGTLQIIVALFGSRRKHMEKIWIHILVWLAYIAADWVATVALGKIASSQPCASETYSLELSNELKALWTAVLLVHLGGPDNITAYSLEDNELWLRHLLSLAIQLSLMFYVLLFSWKNTALTFAAIPVLIIGLFKYGERTFVLWSSSTRRFVASSESDPLPKFVKKAMRDRTRNLRGRHSDDELYNAFFLFSRFARLFSGLILHDEEATKTYEIFHQKSAENAFYLVAVELEIFYDMLYTKASIVYSKSGMILRLISFISFVFELVFFSIKVGIRGYLLIDITITYLLLGGALALEIYGFIRHIFSDWTKLCFTKSQNIRSTTCDAICTSYPIFTNQKRWSGAMGQFNLISYCTKDMPTTCINAGLKLFGIKELMFQYLSWVDVTDGLREMIFNKLKEKIEINTPDSLRSNIELRKSVLAQKGEKLLREIYGFGDKFNWCTTEVEFEYNLLVWHIATDICYYEDIDKGENTNRQIGKWLSDYMLYLLVRCPSIMPIGIGELRFNATCADAMNLFKSRWFEISHDPSEASKFLLKKEVHIYKNTSKKDDALSVLNGGCYLAQELKSLELTENGLTYDQKWKMLSEVWVEMLTYAANQSGWREHIQLLTKGGELLTHVRLLMAHLGLSEQYRAYGREIPK